MIIRSALIALGFLMTSACTYQSAVQVAPAFDVYTSYDDVIPGDWYLYVNAEDLQDQNVRFSGFNCSAHTYPIDVSETFSQSAVRTVGNIVENVTLVDNPVSSPEIERNGYAGQIMMNGQELDADLIYHAGFWTSNAEAQVDITLTVVVDGQGERLLGTTVSGDAEATRDAGSFCGGGAEALGEAASEAVRDTLQRAAESIGNAPRIRARFGGIDS